MRVLQSVPSVAMYKRELRKRFGLRGKRLQAAAVCAAKHGSIKQVLHAAAWA